MSVISDLEAAILLGFADVGKELKKTNQILADAKDTKLDRAELEPLTAAILSLSDAISGLQKVYYAGSGEATGAGQPSGTIIFRPAS